MLQHQLQLSIRGVQEHLFMGGTIRSLGECNALQCNVECKLPEGRKMQANVILKETPPWALGGGRGSPPDYPTKIEK